MSTQLNSLYPYLILIFIDKQDYSFQQMTFTFSRNNTQQCFNIGILDDDINEAEKIFFVMLTTSDPQVILSPDTANITILDNDGKYQFQKAEFIRFKHM